MRGGPRLMPVAGPMGRGQAGEERGGGGWGGHCVCELLGVGRVWGWGVGNLGV